ncbi:MAG: hypothetical protein WDZ94_01180 [Patescibacteria group bacterium]
MTETPSPVNRCTKCEELLTCSATKYGSVAHVHGNKIIGEDVIEKQFAGRIEDCKIRNLKKGGEDESNLTERDALVRFLELIGLPRLAVYASVSILAQQNKP